MKNDKNIVLNQIYNTDARKLSKILGDKVKVRTTITSPPYYDMKDYDSENQVGYGQSYDEYLNDLQSIFKGVLEITEEDGTLWVIIDTFKRNNQVVTLPFDLSNKLKEIGWLLQDVIIWKKDKTVPWSKNGFMQRKFEYILFFSKSAKYKTNKDSVRVYDTSQLKKWWVKYPERYNPKGKALDEVWEFPIPVQGSWGDEYVRHFCPLPQDMVATMIQISTDENDIVLDPFSGSGTVLSQSSYMKRNYIGFETNKSYIEMFKEYHKKTFTKYHKEYNLLNSTGDQSRFENTILDLRSLKYGRVLINTLEKDHNRKNLKLFVKRKGESDKKTKIIKVKYAFLCCSDDKELLRLCNDIVKKPPLSKYNIEPVFAFEDSIDLRSKKYYGYSKTNSYSYMRNVDLESLKVKLISDICVDLNENDYL